MTDDKLKVNWSRIVEQAINTNETGLTAQEVIIKNTLSALEEVLGRVDKKAIENKLNKEFEEKNGKYFM